MYKGEFNCEGYYLNGNRCLAKAYYQQDEKLFCGRHSDKIKRITLKENPDKKINQDAKVKDHAHSVEETQKYNFENGLRGNVTCTKLKMWGSPIDIEGYLKVFPNFKHGNKKDGYGCPGLSPKSLGPVEHIMPNLPVALNLENFHQFSKVFPFEIKNDIITKKSIKNRIDGYNDPIPHRHKYDAKELKKYGKNVNIPLFSVYYDSEGYERRFSYFECRYFYCKIYETMVLKREEFLYLKKLLDEGYNLNIVGYDGYEPTENLNFHYHDTSKPFGHELCLYTLLTIPNSEDYPWNIEYKLNEDKYKGIGINL